MHWRTKDQITTNKNRISVTPEGLREMRNRYLPGGSGPLGAITTICALIELLAEAHGFDIDTETEEDYLFTIAQQSGLRPETKEKIIFGKNDDLGAWHIQVKDGPYTGMFAVYYPEHHKPYNNRCVRGLKTSSTREEAIKAIRLHFGLL